MNSITKTAALSTITSLLACAAAICPFASAAQTGRPSESGRRSVIREIPDTNKLTIANETKSAPNKKGWYYHIANVVDTPGGLVCVYCRTDAHTSILGDIMVARSTDKGRTWTDHKSVAYADVWNQGGIWVAPQLSRLKDGRLVIICDFGRRTEGQDHPMLSAWQKPNRGMSNHLWWSRDNGKTWDGPHKIVEIAPNKLLGVTRIGFSSGQFARETVRQRTGETVRHWLYPSRPYPCHGFHRVG